jgi:hypothetical protein
MYLSENVVHSFAGLNITFSQNPQQAEDFYLQERIGDPRNIVLWAVAGRN